MVAAMKFDRGRDRIRKQLERKNRYEKKIYKECNELFLKFHVTDRLTKGKTNLI